ncbi:uncharacterized protein BO97DRAFT_275804 [Aspergillus homomorphus CBS 101889]|uniref:Zn(2)-C6 fungal-type domain-containing protein n=1 Tax=Aspergillus homomorphus (strain CBS 101889) TaxID=1450537 RepID=A0A395HGP8_ASPHC|nr:hypothetical protein BO97DRAFT_275804 [Aspergillus homomorphus CBS 101889]RAL06930.1 hypothetical protein BO97DRAFT_275804 [Aspergillus homomorphus CBS 101889]
MRPTSACSSCRFRKRKCMVLAPGKPGHLCSSKNWLCDLQALSVSVSISRNPDLQPESDQTFYNKLPQDVCNELADLYLKLVHTKQYTSSTITLSSKNNARVEFQPIYFWL